MTSRLDTAKRVKCELGEILHGRQINEICFSVQARERQVRDVAGLNYRFEYCGRLRALCRPYFLRSTARGSRVTKPAFLSGERKSELTFINARVIPWRIAPACPEFPPPVTFTSISKLSVVWVKSNGCNTIIRAVSRPKYS